MKLVIVNDCAHVMEDIIPYVSDKFDINFIKRTRGLYSKTLGLLFDILRSEGEIYHANYALQDAYLVSVFKHLDVLHVHGSDVRWTLKSKSWGWIVKHDLRSAKKVIYATPDLETIVKEYRPDAVYLPNPVRTDVFIPKESYSKNPRAVYFKLSYESLPKELPELLQKNGIALDVLEKKFPYSEMPSLLKKYDIFIDRFTIESCSKTCLEAMSTGLATIDYRHKSFLKERAEQLSDPGFVEREGRENVEYIKNNHKAEVVAKKLEKIWEDLA